MHPTSTLRHAGLLLGIALGGFLDGILFHQVLQWHHLLSAVDRPGMQDPRVQILADGAFHVLMYAIAAVGLGLLWRARRPFGTPGGGGLPWAWLVLGFGAWQIADVVLFHWILGIHHVRMDVPRPVLWDAGLAAIGVAIVAVGWRLLRRAPLPGSGPGARAALSLAVLAAGAGALLPPTGVAQDEVLVLFGPGTRPAAAFDALAAVDGRATWVDASGTLWAVRLPRREEATQLYARGAWLVSSSSFATGCLGWAKVR